MQGFKRLHPILKGNKKLKPPKLQQNDLQSSQKLGHSVIHVPIAVETDEFREAKLTRPETHEQKTLCETLPD